MILEFFLLSAFSLSRLVANISETVLQTESDPEIIRTIEKVSDNGMENSSDSRELFLRVPMSDKELESLLELQNVDGSWKDIDYQDANRGAWKPSLHAFRVARLAVKYFQKGDSRALSSCFNAIEFWASSGIVSSNWWHNEIGIPRLMGPAFVLLKDRMDEKTLDAAIKIMSASSFRQSGQNKIWQAGNVLICGILKDDADLVEAARNVILSELKLSPGEEGLQPDWSFHQHGAQFQSGNYGLSYAMSLSWWARVLQGTGLDFPEDKIECLRSYVRNGLCPLVWKGWFDHNACARQVFPNAQSGKALCVRIAARNLGIAEDIWQGGEYFPYSDFGLFVGNGWYASVRMQSARTKGYEMTNDENMKGYFSSDGALLVRIDGNEYQDIAPFWNWHHIPGVTSWDDGSPLWGSSNIGPYNKSYKVSGKAGENCMVVAMEYNRDSLIARKAYFFFQDGIVCLGAGISKPGNAKVVTTVEQNLLKGPIAHGKNWVSHRNISYVLLGKEDFSFVASRHIGKWSWVSPSLSDEEVGADVFEMLISHTNPVDNQFYSYAVLPGVTFSHNTARYPGIKVIENTRDKQSVRISGTTMTVLWEPFGLQISE